MTALSLERRVVLWSVLLVATVLLLAGAAGAAYLRWRLVRDLDRSLSYVANHFFEQMRIHGSFGGTDIDLHEVMEWLPSAAAPEVVELERNGVVHFRSARLGTHPLPHAGEAFQIASTPLGKMRVGRFARQGTSLIVAIPMSSVHRLIRDLLTVFAAGFPFLLVVSIFGARWIARAAFNPVRQMADAATGITPNHLERRVPVPKPADDLQRLAQALNLTLDRLEQSFHQARRFTADASHELKSPLALLHADLEALLASPSLGQDDRAAVADALETTKRLSSIFSTLLLLSRADAGHLQLGRERTDLAIVAADCAEDARIMADAAGVTLETNIPSTAPVLGDPTRLGQILGNLFDNAVKYNRPGGHIEISLEQDGLNWILDVINTGEGIPAAQAPRVFERFFRAESHADRKGHGLGLSLARELALAHDAELSLVDAQPEQTHFRLTIPAARAAEAIFIE